MLDAFRRSWKAYRLKSERHRLLLLLVKLSAPVLLLTACQATINSAEIEPKSDFCTIGRPIYFSRLHDTHETIAQVKAHNAVGVALKCGWIPAKKGK